MEQAVIRGSIGFEQAVEGQQEIEQRRDESQMGLHVDGTTMRQMLQLTDTGRQAEHRLDQHPLAPGLVFTELEVMGCLACLLETEVTQRNRLFIELVSQRTKGLVVDVSGVPIPRDHLASVVDQPAQFHAHDPATVRLAFLAQRLQAASFSYRMDQFNAIGVNHREKRRFCQELIAPRPMYLQHPLHPCSVGQLAKQRFVVSLQPPVEGAKVPAFERVQQPYRHHFARIQPRVRPFCHFPHLVIYQTEQRNDKVFRGHGSFLFVV